MTIKDVAAHLNVSEWLVRYIEQRYLERHFARPKLKHLTQIAIDEISVGKGHRYVTVVLDLESGAIVRVGDRKGGDVLTVFWWHLQASRTSIEDVATDLSPAYVAAVREHLPEAALCSTGFTWSSCSTKSCRNCVGPAGAAGAERDAVAAAEAPGPSG